LEKKGPNKPELRGEEEFVRVSWDTALDLAAKALKENFDKYGSESIYGECYWWGGSGKVSWGRATTRRMLTILGGFVSEDGNYSYGAGHVIMPHVIGVVEPNEAPTKWEAILRSAKTIVFWGSNPLTTNEIGIGVPTHEGYDIYAKLKETNANGEKKIYAVDTYKNDTIRYLNSDFIGVVPGTDTAMMIGMCHYLYENNLYDEAFIKKYTVGFNKFKDYFLGVNDNVVKNLDWASKICGVSAKKLEELCVSLAKNESLIISGFAIQRQDHGEQSYWMLITLASMLGHIGKEGCGFMTCDQGHTTSTDRFKAPVLKGLSSIPSEKYTTEDSPWVKNKGYVIPNSRIIDALLNPGKTIDANGEKITYPQIDFIYWVGGNPIVHHQDTNTNIKAWRKPRTIVVNEIYWTPTAKMADIVFPTTTEYERNDITMSGDYSNMHIIPMKQVVAKQHGAKDDYQIFTDLCKAYADGLAEVYTDGGKTEMDWIKEFYEGAASAVNANTALGIQMPSFEQWWEKNEPTEFYETPESAAYVSFEDFRNDPVLEALGTPSGLIEIYSDTIAAMNYKDCGAHPMWFEPVEWLGMKDKPAKFHLLSLHPLDRLHSQQSNTSNRKRYAVADREPVLINTEDAKELGIKQGDLVRVFNARGEILAGANVSGDIMRGVVQIFEGAWYDPNAEGLCKNGNPNVLTIDLPTSELANGNISHTALVNIELYKHKAGEDIKLTAFMPPKGAK